MPKTKESPGRVLIEALFFGKRLEVSDSSKVFHFPMTIDELSNWLILKETKFSMYDDVRIDKLLPSPDSLTPIGLSFSGIKKKL